MREKNERNSGMSESAKNYFGIPNDETNTASVADKPERKARDAGSQERDGRRKTETALFATAILATGSVMLVGATSGGIVIYDVVSAYNAAQKPLIGENITLKSAGKAKTETVSTNIEPITLSTGSTKVTGVEVGYQKTFLNFELPITSVMREANAVETEIQLDPNKVDATFDPVKKVLTYHVANMDLTAKVSIPTGEAKTIGTPGTFAALPGAVANLFADAFVGTMNELNLDVPRGENGTLDVRTSLEHYADFYMVTEVDKKCTPLITQIPNFEDQLKNNIKIVVQGKLFDINFSQNNGLDVLMSLPSKERDEIIRKAVVEIPNNFVVAPDQANIDKLEKSQAEGFYKKSIDGKDSFVCSINKELKIPPVEGAK